MGINAGQYTGSRFVLELEHESAGYLSSFQPPSYEAEEGSQSLGPGYTTRKMLGGPKAGDATATINISQAGPLLRWLESLWNLKCEQRDATVHIANQDYKIKRSLHMLRCLINEVSFPDLNGKDGKKTFDVTTKWRPEDLVFDERGGTLQSQLGTKAKSWMAANFEVHPCFGLSTQFVTSVTLPKVTTKLTTEGYGELRDPSVKYAAIEFSAIKMTMGAAGFAAARELAVKTIKDGHVHEGDEQPISIDMLDQSHRVALGNFDLRNCLLKKFDWAPKLEGGKDDMAVCTLEFLVEDMRFTVNHK